MAFRRVHAFAVALAAVGAIALGLSAAEPPGPTRSESAKFDLAGVPDRETRLVWVDFAPGASEKPHIHNAEIFGFVVAGTFSFEAAGGEKRTVKAGDTFHVLPRQVHSAANVGTTTGKLAVVFVAEKGKPLTEPAK